MRGFSIVEVVIAAALTLAVAAAIFALLGPGEASFAVQPESADMQQRLRVAAGTLYKDLVMAGAGMSRGPNRGALSYYFAPVLPYYHGTSDDDAPGTFRTDTIALVYVPPTVAQTTIATVGPAGLSGDVSVNNQPGCPLGDASCGFAPGMTVVLYDAAGQYDTFTVTSVQSNTLRLESTQSTLTYADYLPNTTTISELTHTIYSLRVDATTATYQLVSLEGGTGVDAPIVDHVVGLTFEYHGDPRPPGLTGKPLSDPAGPWTTYGPPPPLLTEQMPSRGYPAGENCAFVVDPLSGAQVPRLADLGSDETDTLVPLTGALFTDGPWCPDAANVNRWDADLLRIRKIGVTIRVEAANAALRGPAGILFANGGTSRSGQRWLPDQQVTFSVSPRNLGR